jgi:PAS domain S-box-containing protein
MNEDTPLYNIRIIRNHIDFIRNNFPEINPDKLLNYAGISKFQYNDYGYWCSQRQINKFNEILVNKTGNRDISKYTGRHLIDSQNIFAQYILGFKNPSFLALQVGSIYSKLSLGATTSGRKLGKNKVELIIKPKPQVREQLFQCKNRIGSLEGVYKFFLDEYPKIEHNECYHQGDDYCRYIISWDKPSKIFRWIKIRNHSIVIGILLSLFTLIFLPLTLALLITLLSLSGVMYLTQRSFRLEKEKMQKDFSEISLTAEDYWTELNAGYNVTKLVQEVGEITSAVQSEKEIAEAISGVMNKRLEYERGAIFLAQNDKTTLFFAGGYGFNTDEIDLIYDAQFSLNNVDTEGILQKVFNKQAPVLIENMSKIIHKLNPKNRFIAERLNIKSFICVPIIHESESLGVMAVDSLSHKREFRESDINLLMAVASQTALSITHARAFRRLQESERKHRALVETVKDIVYTVNLEGRFTYVSPIVETITGYNNKDLLGRHFVEIVAPAYKETVMKHFADGVQSGNTSTYEIEIITQDEKTVPVELKVTSLTGNMGQSIGRIGVARDITRRKMEETARKELEVKALTQNKLASLGEIATGIAHEINQPLSYIKIILQSTLRDISENNIDNDELHEDFNESLRQTEKISKIISHLRIFGRSDITSLKPVSLSKVLDDALILMHERLRMKNIQFKREIKEDFPLLKGNHTKLEQIFINFIQNSMDAMEEKAEGEIVVSANIENDNALIIYSDNGSGIEPQLQKKIFEPFYTTKEPSKGTGIGLSIVYGIIQEHNGTITCESEEDNGTTFKISLPLYIENIEHYSAISYA